MAAEANSISLNAALDAAMEGPEKVRDFIRVLTHSRVQVAIDRPWNGRTTPDKDMRLMLVSDGENTGQIMLAVFTDASRLATYLQSLGGVQHPFVHRAEVDMPWALLGVPENAGIMVNPNSDRAFRISPEVCTSLRKNAKLGHSLAAVAHHQKNATDPVQAESSPLEHKLSAFEAQLLAGDIEKAKATLSEIPDTAENAKYMLCSRGMLANARGERDLAIRLTLEAIENNESPRLAGKFWSLLGKYYKDAKKLKQAEDAYILACSSDPSVVRYAFELCRLLAEQYRVNEAIALMEQACRIHPKDPVPEMHLGNLLVEFGQEAAALAAFDRAAALDSEGSSVHFNRAICLQALGRLDEARIAFERALLKDPTLDGYSQYMQIRKFSRESPEENAPLLELLQRRTDASMPLSTQIDSNFALAKAYDLLGDLDTSFKYLDVGNRLKRSIITYSTEEMDRDMNVIKKLFTPELIERFKGKANMDLAPVFILGMPRSGSTLTEQILAAHSKINPGNELTHLANMGSEFYEVWNRRIEAGKPDDDEMLRDLRRMGELYAERTRWLQIPGQRFTDKMPGNFLHIGLIYLLFPNASVIHCYRHPADTCLSCYERLFSKGVVFSYDQKELGTYYKKYYLDMMAHWRKVLPPGFILDFKYEDTVEDLEGQVRQLLDFSKLDFEPACMEFHKVERTVTTASMLQVRRPMYKTSVNRWKKYGDKLKPLLDTLGPDLVGPVG